jgi:hypothetical protein
VWSYSSTLILAPSNFFHWHHPKQGYGRKIVDAVVLGTPDDWNLVVVMDWSGGFWDRLLEEYPRIVVF